MREYDLTENLNIHLGDDANYNPYLGVKYGGFTDIPNFSSLHRNNDSPIFLSINVQSLNSKFLSLKDTINGLLLNNSNIIGIALQEVWSVPHPDLHKIEGLQLFIKQRSAGRGGGVGLYIRDGLSAKVNCNLSPFTNGILECLTVEFILYKKKTFITSFYRPPTNTVECTNQFFSKFDELLETFNRNDSTYILLGDANINLLKIVHCPLAQKYLNTVHGNGFITGIFKASRIQGPSYSLIDHILIKNEPSCMHFYTIISDISDHFMTSVTFTPTKQSRTQPTVKNRNFSFNAMRNFRNALNCLDWNNVFSSNDTNIAFNEFFTVFSDLFEIFFPLYTKKISKKSSPINDFMTAGLLISKRQKDKLHKIYLKQRTDINFQTYKQYRNVYNSILRVSKKITIENKLNIFKKKPKKNLANLQGTYLW